MFMQLVFYRVPPACYNIAKAIKPGSNSKKTDKHAAHCSKDLCWGVKWSMWDVLIVHTVIYVRCISCSYNNVVSVFLTKTHFFCLYRKFFMQVRAFERYIPLSVHRVPQCRNASSYRSSYLWWVSFCKLGSFSSLSVVCWFFLNLFSKNYFRITSSPNCLSRSFADDICRQRINSH